MIRTLARENANGKSRRGVGDALSLRVHLDICRDADAKKIGYCARRMISRRLVTPFVFFFLAAACSPAPAPVPTPPPTTSTPLPITTPAISSAAAADAGAAPAKTAGVWPYTTPVVVKGSHGMVVTDNAVASKVGSDVLASGGNEQRRPLKYARRE